MGVWALDFKEGREGKHFLQPQPPVFHPSFSIEENIRMLLAVRFSTQDSSRPCPGPLQGHAAYLCQIQTLTWERKKSTFGVKEGPLVWPSNFRSEL